MATEVWDHGLTTGKGGRYLFRQCEAEDIERAPYPMLGREGNMEAKGKCECGHGPRWHGPYADGYCRGYVRASKSEGTPGYACRCEGWTMADNSRSHDHSIIHRDLGMVRVKGEWE